MSSVALVFLFFFCYFQRFFGYFVALSLICLIFLVLPMVFLLFSNMFLVWWLDCCLAPLLAVVLAAVLDLAVVLDCWIVVYICLDEADSHV